MLKPLFASCSLFAPCEQHFAPPWPTIDARGERGGVNIRLACRGHAGHPQRKSISLSVIGIAPRQVDFGAGLRSFSFEI